jgi:hypothetical protein
VQDDPGLKGVTATVEFFMDGELKELQGLSFGADDLVLNQIHLKPESSDSSASGIVLLDSGSVASISGLAHVTALVGPDHLNFSEMKWDPSAHLIDATLTGTSAVSVGADKIEVSGDLKWSPNGHLLGAYVYKPSVVTAGAGRFEITGPANWDSDGHLTDAILAKAAPLTLGANHIQLIGQAKWDPTGRITSAPMNTPQTIKVGKNTFSAWALTWDAAGHVSSATIAGNSPTLVVGDTKIPVSNFEPVLFDPDGNVLEVMIAVGKTATFIVGSNSLTSGSDRVSFYPSGHLKHLTLDSKAYSLPIASGGTVSLDKYSTADFDEEGRLTSYDEHTPSCGGINLYFFCLDL